MILLDTHALVWWASDKKKLSVRASKSIARALRGDGIAVSAISMWELAMLLSRGRLVVTISSDQWLDQLEATKGLQIIPVDSVIARHSVLLPGNLHDDPADRMIIATARTIKVPLITADKKILDYPHVNTIW